MVGPHARNANAGRPTVTVPTISLWQPWASLCFTPCTTGDEGCAVKRHETRAYPPPVKRVGQRIAIHAAGRKPPEVDERLELLCEIALGQDWRTTVPLGVIVGTVQLVGFGRTEDVQSVTFANQFAGDWTPGRFAWELAYPQPLWPPVPWKGKQGWFMVPEADLSPPTRGPKPVDTGRLRDSLVVTS